MIAVVAIILAVIAVAVIACVVFIVCFCCRKKDDKKKRKSTLNRESLVAKQIELEGDEDDEQIKARIALMGGGVGPDGDDERRSNSEESVEVVDNLDHLALGTSKDEKNPGKGSNRTSNNVSGSEKYEVQDFSPQSRGSSVQPTPRQEKPSKSNRHHDMPPSAEPTPRQTHPNQVINSSTNSRNPPKPSKNKQDDDFGLDVTLRRGRNDAALGLGDEEDPPELGGLADSTRPAETEYSRPPPMRQPPQQHHTQPQRAQPQPVVNPRGPSPPESDDDNDHYGFSGAPEAGGRHEDNMFEVEPEFGNYGVGFEDDDFYS